MTEINTVGALLNELDDIKAVHVVHSKYTDVYIGEYDIECIASDILDKPYKKCEVTKLYDRTGYRATIWV